MISGTGSIDTNVFIHALSHDDCAEECLRFLEAVQEGRIAAHLEPVVVHELSYALPHYRKGMTRREVAEYLLAILAWEGIHAEKDLLISAVQRWRDHARLAFVDAYLAALAARDGSPVYTKNLGDFAALGVHAPNPLPH